MLALNFDTIVFLVIVVVSLLSRLFGKKDPEHAEDWVDGEQWDQPQGNQQQSGPLDWEEQMRRLLEGEPLDKPQPAAEPVPSPVVPAPVATPSVVPPPLTIASTVRPAPIPAAKVEPPPPVPASSPISHMPPATVRHRRRSSAANAAVAMFRNPQSARQAVIASVVLGPPKGLQ